MIFLKTGIQIQTWNYISTTDLNSYTLTNHLWKPPVMEPHYHVILNSLMENKACLSKINSVFGALFAKNYSKKFVGFGCPINYISYII
jgi:hypothetical protein